ncbi:MAG: CDP-alcohol phosphatidyltransferase family protein [Lewinellaceae bacterium]|nr:CDP-alcohol phosphatidyltransferase family protein [Lewinellaceae bacterium]
MKKHIPNAITLLNLFFGCCALASIFYGQYVAAFWWVFAGVAADYGDGMAARLLGVQSNLGKELDSLADMVTFGVVPGAVYYMLLARYFQPDGASGLVYQAAPGFLVSVFSGLRLARFNLDTRQATGFIGLPTPSSTIFTMGVMLIYTYDTFGLRPLVSAPAFLYGCVLVLSYLLNSEIPMFSLKFKSFSWKGNEVQFTFAVIAVVMLFLTREASFSIVILLYVLFSVFQHLAKRRN